MRDVSPSATLSLNELMASLKGSGRTVFKFGFGESPFPPPERVVRALQAFSHRNEYGPVQGDLELRDRIAQFHTQTDQVHVDPGRVIVGTGSKILILNALLAFQSTSVVVPQPSWVTYASQVNLAGHSFVSLPTEFEDRWRIDPDRLDQTLQLCRTSVPSVLILNTPGNPDGMMYTTSELEELARVLRRHACWVISDEIYGLLDHGSGHVSMARAYPERTIVSGGLSKWCGVGGWRLGMQYVAADVPRSVIETLCAVAGSTYSCAATPTQLAAREAYIVDDVTHSHLAAQRGVLAWVAHRCNELIGPSAVRFHASTAGFYLLLDFSPLSDALEVRGISDDVELCGQLLTETGVALLPGSTFHLPSRSLTARLAYVDFDGRSMIGHVHRSGGTVDPVEVAHHCEHLVRGITAMVDWLPR